MSEQSHAEKITSSSIKEFIKNNDIQLIPSQNALCVPIIQRICKKMAYGLKFEAIKICDYVILDGHHRYISALMMKFEIGNVPSQRTSATYEYRWQQIDLDENDWDTSSKISLLNERDARYNELSMEAIKQMMEDLE